MIRRLALGLLLALSACNRGGVADVTLAADASQRNATAAKTAGDLAAAMAASRGPAPIVHDAEPVNTQENSAATTREDPRETAPADAQDQPETQSNDTSEPQTE